jgi:CDP-paratose 2-epimerase
MTILVTGLCGFVGSAVARELRRLCEGIDIIGIDNLSRPGSEQNRQLLKRQGIRCWHGDVRNPSDLEALPKADWVVDAAANPSVLAGTDGAVSSRQLMEHNLVGTLHVLEYCKRHQAGLLLLSTSRVYSLERLGAVRLGLRQDSFVPSDTEAAAEGISPAGVTELFPTQPPLSLYGAAKLASEVLCLEYSHAFGLPIHINRCGTLAGAGQFGKADQGIVSFWIHSYHARRPLKYIGFGGRGHQVRDCLHPRDLAALLAIQMRHPERSGSICNVGGGLANSFSLAQLTQWCGQRFGPHDVASAEANRRFDVPWLVLDCARAATVWGWRPTTGLPAILEEIAVHAETHPDWLALAEAP